MGRRITAYVVKRIPLKRKEAEVARPATEGEVVQEAPRPRTPPPRRRARGPESQWVVEEILKAGTTERHAPIHGVQRVCELEVEEAIIFWCDTLTVGLFTELHARHRISPGAQITELGGGVLRYIEQHADRHEHRLRVREPTAKDHVEPRLRGAAVTITLAMPWIRRGHQHLALAPGGSAVPDHVVESPRAFHGAKVELAHREAEAVTGIAAAGASSVGPVEQGHAHEPGADRLWREVQLNIAAVAAGDASAGEPHPLPVGIVVDRLGLVARPVVHVVSPGPRGAPCDASGVNGEGCAEIDDEPLWRLRHADLRARHVEVWIALPEGRRVAVIEA